MQDPRFCSACGAGPFTYMQNHLIRCKESEKQGVEFLALGIKRPGPALESELRKRWRLPDLTPETRVPPPEAYTWCDEAFEHTDSDMQTDEATLFHAVEEIAREHQQPPVDPAISGDLGSTDNPEGLRRGERVRRPTWKVIQAQIEATPVHLDPPEPQAPRPIPRVHLLVRKPHSQVRDTFGLSRSYKGVPSSVPDNPDALSYIPGYSHPNPRRESRTTEEIVYPYPDLSSFLYDYHFWSAGTSKSRNDRDALQATITRPDFKASDLIGVRLRQVEELRGRSSRDRWEQERGWRKSTVHIGVPTGQKQTAQVRRGNAAHQARIRNAPCPPPSSQAKLDGYPLPVGKFHYRSICEVIRETFSQDPAARTFHYHPLTSV